MAKLDWKSTNIFKILQRQVKDYNSLYNLKDICIAGQAAPASPTVNDVYYYIEEVSATVFGVAGVTAGSFVVYSTVWSALTLPIPLKLQTDQDANGKKIINLPLPVGATEPVRKQEFDTLVTAKNYCNNLILNNIIKEIYIDKTCTCVFTSIHRGGTGAADNRWYIVASINGTAYNLLLSTVNIEASNILILTAGGFVIRLVINWAYLAINQTVTNTDTFNVNAFQKPGSPYIQGVISSTLYSAVSSGLVGGAKVVYISLLPSTYITQTGVISANASYSLKKYLVTPGQVYRLYGSSRGNIAIYAYYADIDLTQLITIGDICNQTNASLKSDTLITIPLNVNYLAITETTVDLTEINIYNKTFDSISDLSLNYDIRAKGDSLTMGAVTGGTRMPFTNKLQELVGNGFNLLNDGIGGENSLTIAARDNSIPCLLKNNITIPANRAWVDLDTQALKGLISSWDGSDIKPLLQGDALQGVYQYTSSYRSYYVYIKGIKCVLTCWDSPTNPYKIVRATEGTATFVPAFTPVIFERTYVKRKSLVDIIWVGTNGGFVDLSDLIAQINAIINYKPSGDYIIIGLHNTAGNTTRFTGDYRTAYKKAFGNRFFDIDKWLINEALAECSITPTTGDNAAIAAGYCPPSLLSDTVHFTAVVYEAIANRLYLKLKEIGILNFN